MSESIPLTDKESVKGSCQSLEGYRAKDYRKSVKGAHELISLENDNYALERILIMFLNGYWGVACRDA